MKVSIAVIADRGSVAEIGGRQPLKRRSARRAAESGQAILEVALLTPLLLLLAIGIIEIGRYAYYSILVANAARAGAQYGAQGLATAADTAGIQTAAKNDAQNVAGLTVATQQKCGCTGSSIGSSCPATGCSYPDHALVYVQVSASGKFNSLFKYPGIPTSISLSSTELMRVAQ